MQAPRCSLSLACLAGFLAASAAGTLRGQDRAAGPARPRGVVVVMTDDQGYGDHSAMGHGVLRTPRMDGLRAESARFDRFYVSPVCSPTRASLMTGRWNYRTRVVDTWNGRSMMDPEETTIAEVLRDAGFATGIFGKWHLGDEYPTRAIDQGFEEALVHRGGGLAQPSEPIRSDRRYTDPVLLANGQKKDSSGYCTGVYFDAALEFIERQVSEDRPFFAYVATNAPHGPFHDVPGDLYEDYGSDERQAALKDALRGASENTDREARICAMVEDIDRNLGRLLDTLEALDVADDTVVVFLHDNGPVPGRWAGGLRGSKTSVYEGGIRTPCFVRWPGGLDLGESGRDVPQIAAHIDLMPTLVELATGALPSDLKLDGRSLAPLLRGESVAWTPRHLVLQSHRGDVPVAEHQFAIVGPRFKLLRASGFGRQQPNERGFELYDLIEDPAESRDLASSEPERVAELRKRYGDWFADVSSTRPDNFAPPRIVVGPSAPEIVELTGQDRRSSGTEGHWLLRVEEATKLRPLITVRGGEEIEAVRWVLDRTGAREIEISSRRTVTYPDTGSWQEIAIGDVDLLEGDHALGAFVRRRGEKRWRPVHQVMLRR